MANEYTPTVWRTGDVITAEKLNKIEEGIANAEGGGESDFSTAEVTLTVDTTASIQGVCLSVDGDVEYLDTYYQILSSDPQVVTAVLYKGESTVVIQTEGSVNISGNIQQITSTVYNITGDCTITISDIK